MKMTRMTRKIANLKLWRGLTFSISAISPTKLNMQYPNPKNPNGTYAVTRIKWTNKKVSTNLSVVGPAIVLLGPALTMPGFRVWWSQHTEQTEDRQLHGATLILGGLLWTLHLPDLRPLDRDANHNKNRTDIPCKHNDNIIRWRQIFVSLLKLWAEDTTILCTNVRFEGAWHHCGNGNT